MTETLLAEKGSVFDWRRASLDALGCSPEVAEAAAKLPWYHLDIHDVETLVDAGCAPDLAIEILMP